MNKHTAFYWFAFSAFSLAGTSSCCVGVSARGGGGAQAATGGDGTSGSLPAASDSGSGFCPNGAQPAADGLIDDLEDGNTQINVEDGRDGYWWTAKDPAGSVIEPSSDFKPDAGGADGSAQAIHVHGHTASGDAAWGVNVGFNFSSGGLYDASKYAGVRFKARVGEGSGQRVRVKVGDVNTHADLGVCETCWNHFGKDMTFSNQWQEYTIFFKEMKQAPGWGSPRPPAITVNQLYSMDFSIDKGQKFDLWVDDLRFVECKQ